MKITVAQLGGRRNYAVPSALSDAGLLEHFFTDSYSGNKPIVRQLARAVCNLYNAPAIRRWSERSTSCVPPAKVSSFENIGLRYQLALRKAHTYLERAKVHEAYAMLFNRAVCKQGLSPARAVYAFDSAALELLEVAKAAGLHCILDQTVIPRSQARRLLTEEAQCWKGWQDLSELQDDRDPLERRQMAEWHLADTIVCGSQFVFDSIKYSGGPVEKSVIIPYAAASINHQKSARTPKRVGEKWRVLFAGEVGLRKGVPYLLEALRTMPGPGCEARFAGRIALSESIVSQHREFVSFLGHVPRSAMAELYDWADVLVLPSIVEGSAAVTYEALAAGVPVICTPNAGAIAVQGMVTTVPARDAKALQEAIWRTFEGPVHSRLDASAADPPDLSECTYQAYSSRLERALVNRIVASPSAAKLVDA